DRPQRTLRLNRTPRSSVLERPRLAPLRSVFRKKVQSGVAMSSKSGRQRPTFTDQEALQFHSQGRPGKLEVVPTKPMSTQRALSLAYSPGVAVPVLAIAADPSRAYDYTAKGHFVPVTPNGTALLRLAH